MATTVAKGSVDKEDVEHLAEFKDKHFGALSGLERVRINEGDTQVGGLSSLRAWLQKKQKMMVSDLRGTRLRPPKGVLLVGVPGCGKSLSAKAISTQWRLPLYRLDMASIMGMYVGQSESRLREALATADQLAPCVLWIDEIEKGISAQDDNNGVNRRLVGQFLFWLQESRHRVFVVATANDVRALPPELLRKGRFDELFFVDLPDEDDRQEIIGMYYRRYLNEEPSAELLDKLVAMSDGFAGADLESVLHEIGEDVFVNGASANSRPDFVIETFANTVPLSRTNPERIEEIRTWGRERAVPAGRPFGATVTDTGPSRGRRVVVFGD
jgi:SpoVK/Ycf46/Vps4 family AAA+-type ATPase